MCAAGRLSVFVPPLVLQRRGLHFCRLLRRAKTPLEMMAEDLRQGTVPSQVGGLDHGIAAVQELSAFERIAERKIQEAQQAGELSNLPGAGRPFDVSRADVSDPDVLEAKILKNAGVLPGWIEEQQALRAEISLLDKRAASDDNVSEQAKHINSKIRAFNQRCPPQFQQPLWKAGQR